MFTLLIEAVNDSVSGQKANKVFYNQHTFVDFHMLFLACLVSMVSTYMHLKKLLEKYDTVGERVILSKAPLHSDVNSPQSIGTGVTPEKLQSYIVATFRLLLLYNRLFAYLVSSASFKSHIWVLQKWLRKDFLMPNQKERCMYVQWANTEIFRYFDMGEKGEKQGQKEGAEEGKEEGLWKWWQWWGKVRGKGKEENPKGKEENLKEKERNTKEDKKEEGQDDDDDEANCVPSFLVGDTVLNQFQISNYHQLPILMASWDG
jgi:hypothetical protein